MATCESQVALDPWQVSQGLGYFTSWAQSENAQVWSWEGLFSW